MKAIQVTELDLKSDDLELFAKAASKCKHGAGYCQVDGFCWADGACFKKPELAHGDALIEIEKLEAKLSEITVKYNHLKLNHARVIDVLEKNIAERVNKKDDKVFSLKFILNLVKGYLV